MSEEFENKNPYETQQELLREIRRCLDTAGIVCDEDHLEIEDTGESIVFVVHDQITPEITAAVDHLNEQTRFF